MWLGAGNRVKVQCVVFVAGTNPSFAESLLLRYFPLEGEREREGEDIEKVEDEGKRKEQGVAVERTEEEVPTDPNPMLGEMSSPDQVTSRPD